MIIPMEVAVNGLCEGLDRVDAKIMNRALKVLPPSARRRLLRQILRDESQTLDQQARRVAMLRGLLE